MSLTPNTHDGSRNRPHLLFLRTQHLPPSFLVPSLLSNPPPKDYPLKPSLPRFLTVSTRGRLYHDEGPYNHYPYLSSYELHKLEEERRVSKWKSKVAPQFGIMSPKALALYTFTKKKPVLSYCVADEASR